MLFLYRRERGRQRAHGCGAWREFSWNRASPRPSFPPADDGRSRERRLRSRLSGRNVVTRLRPAARSRGNGVSSHFFPPEIPTKRRARHSLPWSPSTRNPSSRSGAGSPSARFCCLRVRRGGWRGRCGLGKQTSPCVSKRKAAPGAPEALGLGTDAPSCLGRAATLDGASEVPCTHPARLPREPPARSSSAGLRRHTGPLEPEASDAPQLSETRTRPVCRGR